jgi:hypothetical protein
VAFVVPDGQSETIYLKPIWTSDTASAPVFSGNYDLLIKGDHQSALVANDTIVVNANDSQVQVGLDGQNFLLDRFYDGGHIRDITIDTGGGNDSVTIQGLAADQDLKINSRGSASITIGNRGTVAKVLGTITLRQNPGSPATVTVDDSEGGSRDMTLYSPTLGMQALSWASPSGSLRFEDGAVSGLNIKGGPGTNNFELTVPTDTAVDLDLGTGNDSVLVLGTNAPLTVTGTGRDTVTVGYSFGSLDSIRSPVIVSNQSGTTGVIVNDTADADPQAFLFTLQSVSRGSIDSPGQQIVVTNGGINSLTFRAGSGSDTFTVLGSIAPTTLDTGYGNDTVNVVSSNVALTIQATAPQATALQAQDTVTLGSAGGTGSTLDSMPGVNVSNRGGSTTLLVDGSSTTTTHTVTATDTSISGLTAPATTIAYGPGVGRVTIQGGGSSVFDVDSTASGTPVTILTPGFETFKVAAISQELGLIRSNVTIAAAGVASISLNDQNGAALVGSSGPATYALGAATAAINGQVVAGVLVQCSNAAGSVFFSGIGSTTLYGSSRDDTYNVESTSAPIYLYTGAGHSTVNVSPITHALGHLAADVTISGGGPTDVVVNDQAYPSLATTVAATYRVWSPLLLIQSQLVHAFALQSSNATERVFFSGTGRVTLNGLRGNLLGPDASLKNTYNVESTLAGIPVTLNTGLGTDTVNVGGLANSLDLLQDGLTITGHGSTVVLFNNQGADPHVGHNDVWTANHVNFFSSYHPQTLQVDFSGIGAMTLTDPGPGTTNEHIFYATPQVGGLTINGAANDVLLATTGVNGTNDWRLTGYRRGTLNGVVAFNNVYYLLTAGNSAASSTDVFHFLPGGFVDALSLAIDHATLDFSQFTPGLTVNLPDATGYGSVPGAIAGLANNPGFPAALTVRGTTDNDTFRIPTGASIGGQIIGGGGTDTLDYSAYVGDIVVDLALGTAAGVGGGVSGIANVTGSQGNDVLVGDANANVLRGGTGRSLLIGGAGADQLFGGGGDNIQIGGTTAYDKNLTALAALMKEFTRTDRNFHQRVNDLMTGTGLNGAYVLNTDPTLGPVTVFDDGAADTLTGGGGLDWFFVHKKQDQDVIVNSQAGDKVTQV